MSIRRESKLTRTFPALDKEGNLYTIYEWTEFVTSGHLDGTSGPSARLKKYETDDGRSVNYDDKGKYTLVDSGVMLHSDDPDAP